MQPMELGRAKIVISSEEINCYVSFHCGFPRRASIDQLDLVREDSGWVHGAL